MLGDNRAAAVDDPQPPEFVRLLEMAKKERPEFVISTGDVVTGSESDPEAVARQYRELEGLIDRLGVPFYVARGNHDAINPDQFDAFTRRPWYYTFSVKGCHFWILDTEAPDAPGSIDQTQLEWLRRGLADAADGAKFVVTHRPVLPPTNSESRPYEERGFTDKQMGRDVAHLLEKGRTDIAFGGHEHLFDHQKQGPTNYVTTGGAGAPLYAAGDEGGFFHYIVVDVDGGHVKVELVRLSGERKTLPL